MLMRSGFPDESVSALCMQNAALSENQKTLALASPHKALAFSDVSAQMRRLSGPRGYASRQDVPAAAYMDTASEEEDFGARLAYCKAKRAEKGGKVVGILGNREGANQEWSRPSYGGAKQVLHVK